jgi:hypothetical protein
MAEREKTVDLLRRTKPDLPNSWNLRLLSDEELMGLSERVIDETCERHTKQRAACGIMLNARLAESDLPHITQVRIRRDFADRIFTEEQLEARIDEDKDLLAAIAAEKGEGQVNIPGQLRVDMGLEGREKPIIALDRMFGINKQHAEKILNLKTVDGGPLFDDLRASAAASYDQIEPFRGILEAYTYFTGDPEVTGFFNGKRVRDELARMDFTSTTFTYALANTMHRRLVKEYRDPDWLEHLLISRKKAVRDFRTQEAVLIGGFPDISDVNPEAADYQEIEGITDEESTYSVGQKGNIVTITRKAIINDDVKIFARIPRLLGRAARRAHAKYVWAFIIDNATCSDGTALFTSGHGNLGSSALSHSTAQTAWLALANMTEKDSGERLGLLSDENVKVNLVGPADLLAEINRIETEEFYYTGADDITTKVPNPLKGRVKGHYLPLLTDTNDWCMLVPPNLIELLEMGYLNGREEPEYFVADTPQAEQVFVADKIRHKIRHEYGGTPIDYRGAYKAEVT